MPASRLHAMEMGETGGRSQSQPFRRRCRSTCVMQSRRSRRDILSSSKLRMKTMQKLEHLLLCKLIGLRLARLLLDGLYGVDRHVLSLAQGKADCQTALEGVQDSENAAALDFHASACANVQ